MCKGTELATGKVDGRVRCISETAISRYVPGVMQTMVGITATPGPGDSKAPQPSSLVGVTGSIGLSGKVHGMVYTAFSTALAQHVA